MTFCRPRCGPAGAKASGQLFHGHAWRLARCLTFSLEISRALPPFASSRHRPIAFGPEGLHVGHSFITNNSG